MKRKALWSLLILFALCSGSMAQGLALDIITSSTDIKFATGPIAVKGFLFTPTANDAFALIEDSLTDDRTDIKFDLRGPATNDKITRPYMLGDKDDYKLFVDGVYAVISNATVELILLGDGKSTVTNTGTTAVEVSDPATFNRYILGASPASLLVPDKIALQFGRENSTVTISDN